MTPGHNCAKAIEKKKGKGWLTRSSPHPKDGETVKCPGCHRSYEHVCDEAEGCCWQQARKVRRR